MRPLSVTFTSHCSPVTHDEGDEIVDDIIFADSFQWLLSTDIVALHLSTEWRLPTPRLHCTVALPIIILFCSAGYCDRLWPVLFYSLYSTTAMRRLAD